MFVFYKHWLQASVCVACVTIDKTSMHVLALHMHQSLTPTRSEDKLGAKLKAIVRQLILALSNQKNHHSGAKQFKLLVL